MAGISTLIDDFNDVSLDTGLWVDSGSVGTTISVDGYLNLRTNGGGLRAGVDSVLSTYSAVDSSFTFQLVDIPVSGASEANIYLSNVGDTQGLYWFIENYTDTTRRRMFAGVTISSLDRVQRRGPFINGTDSWFRIRNTGGITYWDTSVDGINWKNFVYLIPPITLTNFYAHFDHYANTVDSTMKIDNVNVDTGGFVTSWAKS